MVDPKIEKVLEALNDFFKSNQNVIIGEGGVLFRKIIGFSRHCIDTEIKTADESFIVDIARSLDILEQVYLSEPISNRISEFVNDYVLLIFNINKNIINDNVLSNRCAFIARVYQDLLTAKEVFVFLRRIVNQYKFMMDYALPSVEISKHYLNSFSRKKEEAEAPECKKPEVKSSYAEFKG